MTNGTVMIQTRGQDSWIARQWKKKVRLLDVGIHKRSCIVVAGTARSGTTWLGKVVAHATRSRQIFEPFLQDKTFNFALRASEGPILEHYQPYVSAKAEPSEWQGQVDQIVRGKIRHWWCDRFARPGIYRRRVIKEVRINLMLDYLTKNLPQVKFLFVVRNPLSVVNSQIAKMKQGWIMQWKPEFVLKQARLMSDWLEPFRCLIESKHSVASRQAIKWCIENLVPLASLPRRDNALIVRYDDLVEDPRRWIEVAGFLADRNWKDHRFRQVVNQVSPVAERSQEQISRRVENLGELDENDRQQIRDIVYAFGLETYWRQAVPDTKPLTARAAA